MIRLLKGILTPAAKAAKAAMVVLEGPEALAAAEPSPAKGALAARVVRLALAGHQELMAPRAQTVHKSLAVRLIKKQAPNCSQ